MYFRSELAGSAVGQCRVDAGCGGLDRRDRVDHGGGVLGGELVAGGRQCALEAQRVVERCDVVGRGIGGGGGVALTSSSTELTADSTPLVPSATTSRSSNALTLDSSDAPASQYFSWADWSSSSEHAASPPTATTTTTERLRRNRPFGERCGRVVVVSSV